MTINFQNREQWLATFTQWAEQQPLVRAVILTSTLAVPGAAVDVFSDYDIILICEDVQPFHAGRGWLEAFGSVLALYRDPLEEAQGFLKSGYVIQFADGLKIDFTLWQVGYMQKIAADPQLPDEFDAGYRVLLDKDRLTEGLQAPTYRAYIPKPPAEADYQTMLENFFVDAVYVAKFLWRDDLVAAKYILDAMMKHENLLPMLEWHLEIEHQWMVKPGPYGRGLKKWLRRDLWTDLENTYSGPGLEENWQALYKTIALMRKTALEVGQLLGFCYPEAMEQGTLALLEKMKNQAH